MAVRAPRAGVTWARSRAIRALTFSLSGWPYPIETKPGQSERRAEHRKPRDFGVNADSRCGSRWKVMDPVFGFGRGQRRQTHRVAGHNLSPIAHCVELFVCWGLVCLARRSGVQWS
ncbi:hypothetical protein GGTG_09683 [Gaeumannomyces tritici R3-111a-1]|uniref:Uncharacterized protein n=1 Tax=Gaeumannomyces tritici (strain R3-111a-1) TaxID=644352 RepID=J3P845_GAET3|nr:hypothetical protein GGTG_09683 [Gaeumannomyces tritici R3-111a-1]EJT72828.1 hypothetical protein GGTG_09683 [Gaeumannomyces tritici R3-111a-1]